MTCIVATIVDNQDQADRLRQLLLQHGHALLDINVFPVSVAGLSQRNSMLSDPIAGAERA